MSRRDHPVPEHAPRATPHDRVRLAVLADAAGVAAVQVAGWRAAYAGILPSVELAELSVGRSERLWHGVIGGSAESGKCVLVAEGGDGEVVGFSALGPEREESERAEATTELYAFYVHPERWGQGIGHALMAATLHLCRQRGARSVKLWVYERNARARTFYARHGWHHDPHTPPTGTAPNELEICYRRQLPASA